jgi:hypothetical protein
MFTQHLIIVVNDDFFDKETIGSILIKYNNADSETFLFFV